MNRKAENEVHTMMHTRNGKGNNNSRRNYNLNAIMHYYVAIVVAIIVQTAHASPSKDIQPSVKINKCCEKFEILLDSRCTNAASVNISMTESGHLENSFQH